MTAKQGERVEAFGPYSGPGMVKAGHFSSTRARPRRAENDRRKTGGSSEKLQNMAKRLKLSGRTRSRNGQSRPL